MVSFQMVHVYQWIEIRRFQEKTRRFVVRVVWNSIMLWKVILQVDSSQNTRLKVNLKSRDSPHIPKEEVISLVHAVE